MERVITYKDPEFYIEQIREQHKIVEKVQLNNLPTLHNVKDYYWIHLFSDGYIAIFNGKKYLKPHIDKYGYFRYILRTNDNKSKNFTMHRIYALAFIDGFKEGLVVDHVNADKLQNKDNLEWVTNFENVRRQKERILGKKLLTFEQVETIFALIDSGYTETNIAKEFNVTQPAISQIINGKRWKFHPAQIEYLSRLEATS
jgi:hypothetical protein